MATRCDALSLASNLVPQEASSPALSTSPEPPPKVEPQKTPMKLGYGCGQTAARSLAASVVAYWATWRIDSYALGDSLLILSSEFTQQDDQKGGRCTSGSSSYGRMASKASSSHGGPVPPVPVGSAPVVIRVVWFERPLAWRRESADLRTGTGTRWLDFIAPLPPGYHRS